MIYETEMIKLRPFTADDFKEPYLSWFHDPEATQWNSWGLFPYTKEQQEEFKASLNSQSSIVWAIIAKDKNIHIGNVSLQEIDYINRSGEFAIIIGNKEFWGKGVASEVIQFIFEHGFNKLNLKRVYAGTPEINLGMLKVFNKVKMIKEGEQRNAIFLNGKYYNIHCYSILDNEWRYNET